MADEYWPGEDAIGKRFLGWRDPERVKTIIGVVGDVRERNLESEARHMVYMPFYQNPWANMYVLMHSESDPASLITAVRNTVHDIAPDKPVSSVRPLQSLLEDSMTGRRFYTRLLLVFASIALALAAAGVYGVIAYSVTQRTAEIGIRMAMGAGRASVLGMIIRQGMYVVLAGAAVGIMGALLSTRLLTSLLYGVDAPDLPSFGAAILFLVAIALLACTVPALRATRVDPANTLHES